MSMEFAFNSVLLRHLTCGQASDLRALRPSREVPRIRNIKWTKPSAFPILRPACAYLRLATVRRRRVGHLVAEAEFRKHPPLRPGVLPRCSMLARCSRQVDAAHRH